MQATRRGFLGALAGLLGATQAPPEVPKVLVVGGGSTGARTLQAADILRYQPTTGTSNIALGINVLTNVTTGTGMWQPLGISAPKGSNGQ